MLQNFPLFYTHLSYITIHKNKTKENEMVIKDKIEPQQIRGCAVFTAYPLLMLSDESFKST